MNEKVRKNEVFNYKAKFLSMITKNSKIVYKVHKDLASSRQIQKIDFV